MKSNEVKITLSVEDEFELMERYGRKCSREGLVRRAIADAIKSNGAVKDAAPKKSRKRKGDQPASASELEQIGQANE